jgi:hypothetical protein
MTHTHLQLRLLLPALAAAGLIATSPLGAIAGQGNQKPAQPTAGKTPVVVEQVENGHGVALVAGMGYRLIAAANGFEDQIQGITGSVTIRFGGGK